MTSKSKQTLLCVLSAVLALALIFSLIRLHNYKNSAKELYSRMQIENAYLFTRDVFLKGDRQTREDNYLLLQQYAYCWGAYTEDENWRAVWDLTCALGNELAPYTSDERAQYLYDKLCDIKFFADMRSGYADLVVDVDAVKALTEEVKNLPLELPDDYQDEDQDDTTQDDTP